MVLNLGKKNKLKLGSERRELLEKRENFTIGYSNKDQTIVNEGIAITGSTTLQTVGLGGDKESMGIQTIYSIKNESGASRNVTIIITNETKGTTLLSTSKDLGDGALTSATQFWNIEQVEDLDSLKLAIGNEGIGTAVASPTFAQYSFEIKAIRIKNDG